MSVSKRLSFVLVALLVGMLTMPVLGQAGGGGGGGGGGGNGGGGPRRGGFNQQAMLDDLKTALGASDDEFAAIQPKILAVWQYQRDVSPRPFGFFGGRGRGGGRFGGGFYGPTTEPSAVQTALQDLQTTLDDPNASPDAIKAKLETLRQARTKARQDLATAQADLRSVLTQRQEAVMVLRGVLD